SETSGWIDENFQRLAEVIQDFDNYLELRWVPPDKRTDIDTSKPYAIVDTRSNYVVFYASELDTPTEILARLFEGDNTKHNMARKVEAYDMAQRAMKLKEEMDRREEYLDKIAWLIGTKKNYINFNGKKFDNQMREIT
ncbi:MAG: hypothetical protein ACREOB_06695, partial [Thermodesulfobacteriota bacterium]